MNYLKSSNNFDAECKKNSNQRPARNKQFKPNTPNRKQRHRFKERKVYTERA